MVAPIPTPDDWNNHGLLQCEEFCGLTRTPQRTVRGWRHRGIGPRWTHLQCPARLHIAIAEPQRLLTTATANTTADATADKSTCATTLTRAGVGSRG